MPQSITRWVKAMAWALLAVNILIVGTGGLVRLTGSGLGCPTWPACTAGSLIPTDKLSFHSIIEFGNRTLTGLLLVVALLAFLSVWNQRGQRPELMKLTLAVGLGIILQAIIGGVTVLLHLSPSVVGVHYFISALLVATSTVYLCRVYAAPGAVRRTAPRRYAIIAWVTAGFVVLTVIIGILLTGAGPHAGDQAAARNGLDPGIWQHIHSWPAYITAILSIGLFLGSFATPRILRLHVWTGILVGVEVVQIFVGLWQARTGLPIVLVNIHMMLAVCLVAAMTAVLMNLYAIRATVSFAPAEPVAQSGRAV